MGIIQRNHLESAPEAEEPKREVISFKENIDAEKREEEKSAEPEAAPEIEEAPVVEAPVVEAPEEKTKKKGGRPRKNAKK